MTWPSLDLEAAPAAGRLYRALIDPMMSGLREAVVQVAAPAAGAAVLDVGCGTGAQLKRFAGAGRVLVGIDQSRPMVAEARRVLGDAAAVYVGDGTRLPFGDASFDLVLLSLVLHASLPGERERLLRDARRVLRSEGRLAVVDYRPAARGGGVRGRLVGLLVHAIERLAGRTHYAGYRGFMAGAGVEGIARRAGFHVDRTLSWGGGGGGVIGIYLLRGCR